MKNIAKARMWRGPGGLTMKNIVKVADSSRLCVLAGPFFIHGAFATRKSPLSREKNLVG
ncbi:hypothetical protein [Paenibacillus eucommiae]|uniref:Uncharacterized protein n=1 Tax=Paenibacillus eucommiae TaxID=1355755 RepID=A0ABS4J6E4_9BACL|nr:hypothetical protein [Paenibacillus eucommiae]MBP1995388.1 hypothetical protein [Paenibacillus eucommiae]